jgi:hypothetical protein
MGDAAAAEPVINWDLLSLLAGQEHKHLNITAGQYGVMVDGVFQDCSNGVGEVMQEARAVQHLCDIAGVPEGTGHSAHIHARVLQLFNLRNQAADRLERIAAWHSRETGPGGMVGDYCRECGQLWPCDSRKMAEGTYVDDDDPGPGQ